MQAFILKRVGSVGRDEAEAMVVVADSYKRARELAAMAARDEGPGEWLSLDFTTCQAIVCQVEGVVLVQTLDG